MIMKPLGLTCAVAALVVLVSCSSADNTPVPADPTSVPTTSAPSSRDTTQAQSRPGASAAPTSSPLDAQTGLPKSGVPVTPTANPDRATATPMRTPMAPGRRGTPRGQGSSLDLPIDRSNPDDLAASWGQLLQLTDCRIDNRPNDATRRAVDYVTGQLEQDMLSGAPVGNPGHRWIEMCSRDGWTTTEARLGGLGSQPPDQPTQAWRAVTVTTTDHGVNGWTGPTNSILYIVELTRPGNGDEWLVAGYELQ